jgi:anti-anti-sigma regulatory factor
MSALLVPDVPGSAAVDDLSSWLTVVLRPAGELAGRDAARLARALVRSCAAADAVILDLRAVDSVPAVVRRAVADAAALLGRSGGALLVVDADGRHHLGGEAVEIDAALLPPH